MIKKIKVVMASLFAAIKELYQMSNEFFLELVEHGPETFGDLVLMFVIIVMWMMAVLMPLALLVAICKALLSL